MKSVASRFRARVVASGFSRTLIVAALMLAFTHPGQAQLAGPNAAGVSMGHLHFRVKDIETTRRFWLALGGRTAKTASLGNLAAPPTATVPTAIVFPDVIVILSQGVPTVVSDSSVVNHVAFRVRSFSEVEAAGFTVQRLQQFPGVGSITTPDGERIELFENAATNLTFVPDEGPIDAVAARHNRPLAGPIAFHHIHLNVPGDQVAAAKAWYARVFGGTPGKRSTYDAVDLPGVNINISASAKPLAGTAGRSLESIGFEVRDLESFMSLRTTGVARGDNGLILDSATFDVDGRLVDQGPRRAGIVDPWGTVIVLTEGLGRW